MLFNSIEFLVFLPIVFSLYWFVLNKNLFFQNLLILLSSYLFYGWWDDENVYVRGFDDPVHYNDELGKIIVDEIFSNSLEWGVSNKDKDFTDLKY